MPGMKVYPSPRKYSTTGMSPTSSSPGGHLVGEAAGQIERKLDLGGEIGEAFDERLGIEVIHRADARSFAGMVSPVLPTAEPAVVIRTALSGV